MKQICKSVEEVHTLLNTISTDPVSVSVQGLDNGDFEVTWVDRKTYTDENGNTVLDEAWVTRNNEILHIQDIGLDHCRNILRMLLRQQREESVETNQAVSEILRQLENEEFLETSDEDLSTHRILH